MKQIFTLAVALILGAFSYAQEQQPDPKAEEKIQAMEVGYISQKLKLTTDEAQKFWPIYNDYKKDISQVIKTYRQNPDADILDRDQKIIDVRKKYRDRFVGVIGPTRVRTFFQAEGDFRKALMNRLKNNPQRPMLQRRNRN
jgi:lipopolysaccharide export LptBFGC system permease protein LptF